MASPSVQVNVMSLARIAQTLSGLVRPMFGPCGEQTLLSTHTGNLGFFTRVLSDTHNSNES